MNTTKHAAPILKKLTAQKVDLAKQVPGFELTGKFVGLVEGEPFTRDGVTKTIFNAIFEVLNSDERITVIADKGLQGALKEAGVTVGMAILIKKLPKIDLKGSKTMNQYEIYSVNN
jgi:hypothetical protein